MTVATPSQNYISFWRNILGFSIVLIMGKLTKAKRDMRARALHCTQARHSKQGKMKSNVQPASEWCLLPCMEYSEMWNHQWCGIEWHKQILQAGTRPQTPTASSPLLCLYAWSCHTKWLICKWLLKRQSSRPNMMASLVALSRSKCSSLWSNNICWAFQAPRHSCAAILMRFDQSKGY